MLQSSVIQRMIPVIILVWVMYVLFKLHQPALLLWCMPVLILYYGFKSIDHPVQRIIFCTFGIVISFIVITLNSITGLLFILPLVIAYVIANAQHKKKLKQQRHDYILNYLFPALIQQRFLNQYPLTQAEMEQVELGLKQFFLIALERRGKVAMPSKIVDEYWHAFLLSTRHYQLFCEKAFGRVLHHLPEAHDPVSPHRITHFSPPMVNAYVGAKAVSRQIPAMTLSGFPLLFMLDQALGVDQGFYYDHLVFTRLEQQIERDDRHNGTDAGSCGASLVDGCGESGGGADGCGCSSSCGGGCGGD